MRFEKLLTTAILVVALPLAAAAPAACQGHPPDASVQRPSEEGGMEMMAACREMMAHHQQMQERMAAMDAELDQRMAAVRAATGEAKVEATAAALETLVEQRRAMHEMMAKRHASMMQHMMGHMGHGEGLAGCPMMQRMHGPAEEGDEESPHPHQH
jgi:hypothetical protein